jgi:hypothetical protein
MYYSIFFWLEENRKQPLPFSYGLPNSWFHWTGTNHVDESTVSYINHGVLSARYRTFVS